jgi:hypothetical protein
MNPQKVKKRGKCHASEPCAELDSALVQHLTKSMIYETLKQVQGDKSGLFTRPSKFKNQNETP